MARSTTAEQADRTAAMDTATRRAIEVPLRVMEVSLASFEVIRAMADIGNPASASDVGVGALCARAAVRGAGMNVRTNAANLDDREAAGRYVDRASELEELAEAAEVDILAMVAARS